MTLRHTNPDSIHPTSGYTHIVEATGGRTVYISGQIAFDREGKLVGEGDMRAQAEQVFANLKAALEAAGGEFEHLVKVVSYVADMAQLGAFREVRTKYLSGPNPPASTLLGVTALALPAFLVEVDAIAVIPD